MRKYIWVIVGALVCGTAVAMVSGAGTLPWLKFVPLALIALGVAATFWWGRREYQQHARTGDPFGPADAAPSTPPTRAVRQREQETLEYIQRLLDEKTMTWLATEEFDGSWRDQHVRALRELTLFDDNRGPMSDVHLERALGDVIAAVRGFLFNYDTTTITDPLLHGEIWRIVAVDPSGDGNHDADRAEIEVAAEDLRARARIVIEAHAEMRRMTEPLVRDKAAKH